MLDGETELPWERENVSYFGGTASVEAGDGTMGSRSTHPFPSAAGQPLMIPRLTGNASDFSAAISSPEQQWERTGIGVTLLAAELSRASPAKPTTRISDQRVALLCAVTRRPWSGLTLQNCPL